MNNATILKPSSFLTMPWRNGQGTTIELLKQDLPDAAGFMWRLSMADVSSDGEFSDFSGYDRTLLLLDGNGITLDADPGQSHILDERLDMARFAGEDRIYARLHDGPITDFNVMTNRGYCSAGVQVSKQVGALSLNIDADLLLIYAVESELQVSRGQADEIRIPAKHLLVCEEPDKRLLPAEGAAFIAIQIRYLER